MEPTRRLDDDALAEEIVMYGDLVVAASEADGSLSQAEIDRLLGVGAPEAADATGSVPKGRGAWRPATSPVGPAQASPPS